MLACAAQTGSFSWGLHEGRFSNCCWYQKPCECDVEQYSYQQVWVELVAKRKNATICRSGDKELARALAQAAQATDRMVSARLPDPVQMQQDVSGKSNIEYRKRSPTQPPPVSRAVPFNRPQVLHAEGSAVATALDYHSKPQWGPRTRKPQKVDSRANPRGHRINVSKSRAADTRFRSCPCSCPTHPELQSERVSVSAGGDFFACVGTDGRASIWDNYTASRVDLTGTWLEPASVWDIAWSPHGASLATGSSDGIARVWDGRNRSLKLALKGHLGGVTSVAWSPNGAFLATGSADATARLWEIRTGALRHVFQGHRDVVSSISWSPDARAIASGSWDTDVRVWNTVTGALIQLLDVESSKYEKPDANMAGAEEVHTWHDSWVWHVSWSPDGNTLAIAAEDCTVKLYNRRTGKVRRVLGGDFFFFFAAAWSPDGATLATCSDNKKKSAKIWSSRSGTLLRALKGHTDLVTTLAFSPDGHILATGSHDGTTRLWDSSTGSCIRILEGHSEAVKALAWHPGGHEVFTASEDGTVRIYQIMPPNPGVLTT